MAAERVPKPSTPIPRAPLRDQFEFGPWTCLSTKSHILKSEGPEREEFEAQLALPHLPEMIFAKNSFRIEHQGGFGIEFNALDALRLVDAENDSIKVAEAEEWLAARADSEHINHIIKPFDWTFTTEYTGTLFGHGDSQLTVTETDQKIDLEKLKTREKIHFYADILLFEDELHDCGTSMMSVKIRVMPSCFFILLRFFLRVDNVLIRANDTRIFHEAGTDYILREFLSRESKVTDINLPPHLHTDPNLICDHLQKKTERIEKLSFPSKWASSADNPQSTPSCEMKNGNS